MTDEATEPKKLSGVTKPTPDEWKVRRISRQKAQENEVAEEKAALAREIVNSDNFARIAKALERLADTAEAKEKRESAEQQRKQKVEINEAMRRGGL